MLLQQAQTLKDYRDCRGAVRVSAVLVQNFPDTDVSEKGYRLIQACLREHSWNELRDLADHPPAPRVGAMAMLVIANSYHGVAECPRAIVLYDEIVSRYPGTPETWRAIDRKVVDCLVPMGRDREAISSLEQIVQEAGHSPQTAWALYQLAVLHRWRGERDDARAELTQIIRDYPRDLEYPSRPGIKVLRSAELDLRDLNKYILSPFFDQAVHRVGRLTGLDRSPWNSSLSWALYGLVGW